MCNGALPVILKPLSHKYSESFVDKFVLEIFADILGLLIIENEGCDKRIMTPIILVINARETSVQSKNILSINVL